MTPPLREAYLHAVRSGDRKAAFRVVEEARAGGTGARELYLDVFQPTLREIGRLWQENAITVADEHLATAITQAVMASMVDEVLASGGTGPSLLAACADFERHEIGLRMVCDFLEMEGWDTAYLGAAVPIESLVRMVRERKPDAVALSVSLAPHVPRLRAMIRAIRDEMGDETPVIAVGGRPFHDNPELARRVGADLTARDAGEAVQLLRARVAP